MIKNTIKTILFQNNNNFYTILKINTIKTNKNFNTIPTIIKFLPNIIKNNIYTFKKQIIDHPHYNKQLKTKTFKKKIPQTKKTIINYLSNNLFKNINKKTTQNIINTLNNNTINNILNNHSILKKISKLSKKKQKQISKQISTNQKSKKIIIHLHNLKFNPKLSITIYQFYLNNTLTILDQNPYQLIYNIKNINFNKTDQLTKNINITYNNNKQLKTTLLYTLKKKYIKQKHTYLPINIIINLTINILNYQNKKIIKPKKLNKILQYLNKKKQLIINNKQITIPNLYYSKIKNIQNLFKIKTHTNKLTKIKQSNLQIHINKIKNTNQINYTTSQKKTLQTTINSKIILLTNKPKTKKTTIIKNIIKLYTKIHNLSLNYNNYINNNYPIILTTPTKKTSKKLQKSTKLKTITIHHLIN